MERIYTVININGFNMVLVNRSRTFYGDANFYNTGKALVGQLVEGENLDEFLKRRAIFSKKHADINYKLLIGIRKNKKQ